MSEFQARFARRFGCTVNVLTGREFDSSGSSADQGGSCATCGDCNRHYGDVGVASDGVVLENSVSCGLQLRWACPSCGNDVYEDTTLLAASTQARAAKDDPLCFPCRRKASKNAPHSRSLAGDQKQDEQAGSASPSVLLIRGEK